MLESCWLPDHMFDMNIRHELSSTVPSPSRHRVEPAGEVGELADVVARDALVGVGPVVVRGGVVGRADVEERVEQAGEVAAEQQRGDARLVGLERQGDDVAHQPHVLADVFGQAVVGPRHRDGRPAAVAWPARRPGPSSARMRSTRFSTSRTLVRYSSSLAWSAELTCRLSAGGLLA